MTPEVAIASPRSSIKRQVRAKAKTTLLIACKFKYQVSAPQERHKHKDHYVVQHFSFSPAKQQGSGASASHQV